MDSQTRLGVHEIAYCSEHGLHGERDDCFECGRWVEQVPMVWYGWMHVALVLGAVSGLLGGFAIGWVCAGG